MRNRRVTGFDILLQISVVFEGSGGRYGSRRVRAELASGGLRLGRERVRAVMAVLGISGVRGRALRGKEGRGAVSRVRHRYECTRCVAPDHLRRRFGSFWPSAVWVADFTEVRCIGGELHVGVCVDLFSRRVVSVVSGVRPDSRLATLMMTRGVSAVGHSPVVVHTDRGGAFASRMFRDFCASRDMIRSMSRRHNPWDNAVGESIFATLKSELIYLMPLMSRRQTMTRIRSYVRWYNEVRLHSSLGYRCPLEFEREYFEKLKYQNQK